MTLPFISVLIPVYGVEKYVEHCVRSLFENSIADKCEFVVVNDCTADNSMDIVETVACEYPYICVRFIEHESNRGLAAARNTALLQAHGKYIICVDSDDWVEPDYLEKLYAEAEDSGADIVGCDLFCEEREGSFVRKCPLPENPHDCIKQLLEGKVMGWLHEKLFRASLFKNEDCEWVEGLDMTEDVLICVKAFYYAKKIAYVEKTLYHYNLCNQNALTSSLDENKIEQILAVNERIEEFLKKYKCLEFYKEAMALRKAFSKIWILIDCISLKKIYFDLYRNERLSRSSLNSVKSRGVLFLCDCKLYILAKLVIVFYRKHIQRERG